MAHMADMQACSVDTGSEEISTAKFVSVGVFSLEIGSNTKPCQYIKAIGITQITSNKLVYFANIWRGPFGETCFIRTVVGLVHIVAPNPDVIRLSELEQEIHSVAVLSDERIILAASDHLKTMSFIQNETRLKQLRDTYGFECYDIACVLNKLVFAYKDGIGIWDISGVAGPVLTIKLPGITTHSSLKVCATIEHDLGVIYVVSQPSMGCNLVTKLSLTGKIIKAFNNLDFTRAGGICASGDGHLYMSFPDEHCIRDLVPDMSRADTVIQDLNKPSAICYCQETRMLFVNCNNEDVLQVIHIK